LNILNRYIVREMVSPFCFGLAAFTILFFSVETLMGVARMVVESHAGFGIVIDYLGDRLPQVVVFTSPMAILLAALLAFGRISGDSELTAMRAAGLSFLRIAFPGLMFCFFVSAVNLYINDRIVPPTMKKAFNILIETQKKDPFQKALLTQPRVLKNGDEQMVYAHQFNLEKREMRGVFVHYFRENRRVREVYADEAHWDGKVWILHQMRTVNFDRFSDPEQEVMTGEAWTPMQPDESPSSPDIMATREFRPEEMSREELRAKLAVLPQIKDGDEEGTRKRHRYEVMYHQKLALPWTSLIFGTFAIPLGVRPHRASTSMGVGLSVLFILIYYVLMTVGMIFGETGALSPAWSAWLPNVVFGSMGAALLVESSRR
jgi:lipopolysaccharide export system permease protein